MQNFPSTDWSQVLAARNLLSGAGRSALATLLDQYLPALKWHLVRHYRLSVDQADETLQQFALNKVIESRLLDHVDRERGKFRTFLLTVLRNFLLDQRRREATTPSLLAADLDRVAVSDHASSFDQLWAEDMIAEAIRRTRAYLIGADMEGHWIVFHARVVAPSYGVHPGADISELLSISGFSTPRQVSNALANAKRVFRRELAQLLGHDPRSEPAIGDLLEILGRRATASTSPRM